MGDSDTIVSALVVLLALLWWSCAPASCHRPCTWPGRCHTSYPHQGNVKCIHPAAWANMKKHCRHLSKCKRSMACVPISRSTSIRVAPQAVDGSAIRGIGHLVDICYCMTLLAFDTVGGLHFAVTEEEGACARRWPVTTVGGTGCKGGSD